MKGALGRIAVPIAVLMCLWAGSAAAQLYRWVDPETGSVKYSSYPPPWFNDAVKQPRTPKVEVIAPSRIAPAFEPRLEGDREPVVTGADLATKSPGKLKAMVDDRRNDLVKTLAQHIAALISSPPESMAKPYLDMVEVNNQLENFDRKLRLPDQKADSARFDEKKQFAFPLESRRTVLLQQIASQSPPPLGSPPEKIQDAWANTQRLVAALGWIDNAIVSLDPGKKNSRHFEMNALIDKLVQQWEPHVDPGLLRKNRGR